MEIVKAMPPDLFLDGELWYALEFLPMTKRLTNCIFVGLVGIISKKR